jgi:hypothetical protein
LLFDLESVEGVLDKLFLGFSSVESLKVHSLADLNDFSKTVYNFVCLLKSVERAFQQSLLDFRLRSSDTDLTCDKLAERNACNLSIWKAIIRDSGSLLEETVLLLDSIRQNNVVKTMRCDGSRDRPPEILYSLVALVVTPCNLYRLNAWQNLREKVALQVNRLRLDIKKAAPLSTLSARGAKSEVSEVPQAAYCTLHQQAHSAGDVVCRTSCAWWRRRSRDLRWRCARRRRRSRPRSCRAAARHHAKQTYRQRTRKRPLESPRRMSPQQAFRARTSR